MNTPLHTYEPINQAYSLVWVALGIFVGSALLSIWLFRQPSPRMSRAYTGLVGMLVGFIAMIALGAGVFGWLAIQKNQPLHIYADRLEFGKQIIAYQNLSNAEIEESRQTSWINPNITRHAVQLLFLTDKRQRTLVLSEEHYPIRQIMTNLREAVRRWEASEQK